MDVPNFMQDILQNSGTLKSAQPKPTPKYNDSHIAWLTREVEELNKRVTQLEKNQRPEVIYL